MTSHDLPWSHTTSHYLPRSHTVSRGLPLCPSLQLSTCLASLPKNLVAEQSASLLQATIAHGHETLGAVLQRSDVTALLLGVLCSDGLAEQCAPALSAFYAALLPLAAAAETPWALLNAILPVVKASHGALLQAALGQLSTDSIAPACQPAHAAFSTRLTEHLAALN